MLYQSFYFFLANSLGKVGGAVSLCIIAPFATNLVLLAFDANIDANFSFLEYWISHLSTIPFELDVTLGDIGWMTIISSIHIIAWCGFGYLINRKKQF